MVAVIHLILEKKKKKKENKQRGDAKCSSLLEDKIILVTKIVLFFQQINYH